MASHTSTAATTHRERKELFVTGHAGTSPLECLVVSASAPVGTFLFLELRRHPNLPPSQSSWRAQALTEAAVLLFPMAICQTEVTKTMGWGTGTGTYSEAEEVDAAATRAMTRTTTLLASELVLALALHLSRRRHHWGLSRRRKGCRRNVEISEHNEDTAYDNRKPGAVVAMRKQKRPPAAAQKQLTLPFLTSYRATVSYLTFVAILAVDFRVFPRRYAKTEEGGCGLMDLGAASFVISGGFVSRHARRSLLPSSTSAHTASGRDGDGDGGAIRSLVVRALPLVILGLVRLVGNSGLDYQEHVSEYGVHWNFFFTLASVGVLSASVRSGVSAVLAHRRARPRGDVFYSLTLPAVVLALYQLALSLLGWQEFVEDGPRRCTTTSSSGGDHGEGASDGATIVMGMLARSLPPWACDFFAANREGILGTLGYLSLFWMSEEVASYCLWSPMAQGISRTQKQREGNGDGCSASLAASPGGGDGHCKCGDKNALQNDGGSPSDATGGGKLRRRRQADTRGDDDGGGSPLPPPRSDDDGTSSMARATRASKESTKAGTGNTGISMSREVSLMQGSRLLVCTVVLWCVVMVVLRLSHHEDSDWGDNEQKENSYYHPISRRSTNALFVLWSLSHNVTILLLTWSTFFISSSPSDSLALDDEDSRGGEDWLLNTVQSPSPIFTAVNRNGLVVFLVANLLTGAVNMSVDTLEASNTEAQAIITVYLCAVGGIALALDMGMDTTVKLA